MWIGLLKTGRAEKAGRTYQQDTAAQNDNRKSVLPSESVSAAFEVSRWIP